MLPTDAPAPPDSRLLQANERTLLAWIRTGLALLTFGFVVARIGLWLRMMSLGPNVATRETATLEWVGATVVLMGIAACAMGTVRYVRTNRALWRGEPVPATASAALFGVGVTVAASVVGAWVLSRLL